MNVDKKLSELTLQILVSTLNDNDRLYVSTSGQLDAYMTGATLKAIASGNVSEVAIFADLPASAADGKLFMVVDASGDPALTNSTAAWYQYRIGILGYTRVTSVEELAGGGGDMLKSVYDPGNTGQVQGSDFADDLSGVPGNSKYYGTDVAGNKGFYNFGATDVYTVIAGTVWQVSSVDDNKFNSFVNNALISVTIPTNALDPIAIDSEYRYYSEGTAGFQFTVAGLTIKGQQNFNGNYAQLVQYDEVRIKKIATDSWAIWGGSFGVIP